MGLVTGIHPEQAPSARAYLIQQLDRFRVAVHEHRGIKELRCDLILVAAAVDDLMDEMKKDGA